jgi:hypothetical protein
VKLIVSKVVVRGDGLLRQDPAFFFFFLNTVCLIRREPRQIRSAK